MYESLAVFALFALVFSVLAGGLSKTWISGPIVFLLVGLVLGQSGFGLIGMNVTTVEMRLLADLTLALVLFIDAALANVGVLKQHRRIPQRMLGLGLPLAIALGVLFGWLLFDSLSWYELAILATMLAATDAALGKAVVTHPDVPEKIREGLNAESGLNDGLCVPLLFFFLALAVPASGAHEASGWALALELVATEIGIGLAVGLAITYLGVKLIQFCEARGWVTEIWRQIPVLGMALGCFAVAQSLHGSGYIAAFAGGILFGQMMHHDRHHLVHSAEGTSELLAMLTWISFGAVIGVVVPNVTIQVVIYAILSLVVVRTLAIFLSLTGTGETTANKLFLGWFGPRGLASVVFAIIVWNAQLPGGDTLVAIVAVTVFLSVVLHGLSANPLIKALANRRGLSAGGEDSS